MNKHETQEETSHEWLQPIMLLEWRMFKQTITQKEHKEN